MLRPEVRPASLKGCLNNSVCILRDDSISTHFEVVSSGLSTLHWGVLHWCAFTWKLKPVYFDQILILTWLLLLIFFQGAHSVQLESSLVIHEALHACNGCIVLKGVQTGRVEVESRLIPAFNDSCIVTNVTLLEQHCILTPLFFKFRPLCLNVLFVVWIK